MDTSQSTGQNDIARYLEDGASGQIAHDGHDFGRRNPLEIGVQLRNLVNRRDFLTVQYKGGQLVTRILAVDVRGQTFTFDWGALPELNRGALTASRCQFRASQNGVRVEFATSTPRERYFEGLPAFEADFPEVLYHVQRREYFRVDAPVLEPYVCRGHLPDGETFRCEVHDLSLGGVGVYTTDERIAGLPIGVTLPDVELSLGGLSMLSLDVQLVSHRAVALPDGTQRCQLGFRFVALPGSAENTLQRLITQLEMKRRSLIRA